MSLINQMLRDLEQRKSIAAAPPSNLNLQPVVAKKRFTLSRSELVLTGIAILTIGGYYWENSQPDLPIASVTINTPRISPPAKQALAEQIQQPIQPTIPATTEPAAPIIPTLASAQNPQIDQTEQNVISPELTRPVPSVTVQPTKFSPEINKPVIVNKPVALAKPAKPSSPTDQIAMLYRQAKSDSSFSQRKKTLENILQLAPFHLPARTLLLQTLLKADTNESELAEYTEQSLSLFPDNLLFIKTRAHLYIQQKNFAAAINVLEKANAENISDSAYLALLAASYAQIQQYAKAEQIYQKLTELQPEKAENWLGLGIANDKLNQTNAAIAAYQQALDKNTLHSEVVDYINDRLRVLN